MEILYDLVKNIVYFMFFVNIAERLVQGSKMEKYIRLYVGLLLCVMLVDGVSELVTGKKIKWSQDCYKIDSNMKDLEKIEEEFRQQEEKIQEHIEEKCEEYTHTQDEGEKQVKIDTIEVQINE